MMKNKSLKKLINIFFIFLFATAFSYTFAESKSTEQKPNEISENITKEMNSLDSAMDKDFSQIEYKGTFLKMILSLIIY